MEIRPTSNVSSTSAANLQTNNTASRTESSNSIPVDQVDISIEAQSITQANTGDIRADRVAEIRTQIASGQYDTPEKMEVAVARLFDEFA
jgi:negative regulator of flagellin synthesis FlgM